MSKKFLTITKDDIMPISSLKQLTSTNLDKTIGKLLEIQGKYVKLSTQYEETEYDVSEMTAIVIKVPLIVKETKLDSKYALSKRGFAQRQYEVKITEKEQVLKFKLQSSK